MIRTFLAVLLAFCVVSPAFAAFETAAARAPLKTIGIRDTATNLCVTALLGGPDDTKHSILKDPILVDCKTAEAAAGMEATPLDRAEAQPLMVYRRVPGTGLCNLRVRLGVFEQGALYEQLATLPCTPAMAKTAKR